MQFSVKETRYRMLTSPIILHRKQLFCPRVCFPAQRVICEKEFPCICIIHEDTSLLGAAKFQSKLCLKLMNFISFNHLF